MLFQFFLYLPYKIFFFLFLEKVDEMNTAVTVTKANYNLCVETNPLLNFS